MVCMVAE
jgi:hypothetical protein